MADSILGTPIAPSRIAFGTVWLGSQLSRDASFALLDEYFALGGNFIDSAHIYAAWREDGVGASERTIGEWIRSRNVQEQIVLATKGAHPPLDAEEKIGRCAKSDIESDLAESLERLGLEHIDLYWLHFDEPTRPVGEIIETLASLLRDGRIGSYGASNWQTERIDAANHYAAEHSLPPFVASEPWWSLGAVAQGAQSDPSANESQDPLRDWHLRTRLPMVPYSSQANGFFGAKNVAWAKAGFDGPPRRAEGFDSPANRHRLLRAIALAEKKGCTANQIAIAYLLNQPFPVFPIVGTSTHDHLREAMGAVGITLSDGERASLFQQGE